LANKDLLSHSFRIAWKDIVELYRNKFGLVLLIVMPIFMMGMVGFIYPSNTNSGNNLPVAVVNLDGGNNNSTLASQAFISVLQQINGKTSMFKLTTLSSEAALKDSIQSGDLEGGIIIPSNFSASILGGKQGTVMIMTDTSNPQVSATIQTLL